MAPWMRVLLKSGKARVFGLFVSFLFSWKGESCLRRVRFRKKQDDNKGFCGFDAVRVKALKGQAESGVKLEDWEDVDLRVASQIRLLLANNVLANVSKITTTKDLWSKLEELYMTNTRSNRLYLKEQFHTLKMAEGTSIANHLSVLNSIVSELEALEVTVNDEDKALRLILSLPPSYKHMVTYLKHGKDALSLSEVTNALLSEENEMKSSKGNSLEDDVLYVGEKRKHGKSLCWKCLKPGHIRRDCKWKGNGTGPTKGPEGQANHVDDASYESDFFGCC
ncbi:hypothetical protein C5167_001142 [Papaver somniferum]|uniref:CCHC-type domain-containing protein n=1 Tax=Papaver somniferum TaxID=3469 RepID=A0A4Y7KXM7_PAPSO|nr:hypothetical protein C5167_001142 [Papaver somniferum]